jgi:hypothetical protein
VLGASAVVVVLTQASHAPRPVDGEAIQRPRLASAQSFLRQRGSLLSLTSIEGERKQVSAA